MKPTRWMLSVMAVLALGAIVTQSSLTDVIILKSGRRLEGKVKESGDLYSLTEADGSRSVIPKRLVKEFIKDPSPAPKPPKPKPRPVAATRPERQPKSKLPPATRPERQPKSKPPPATRLVTVIADEAPLKNAWQTKGRILLGTRSASIRVGAFVADENTFGLPERLASPKTGYCLLLIQIPIKAKTDKQWVEAIRALSLKDAKGKTHKMDEWLLNGAYRPKIFLSMAEGQGVCSYPSTTIAFYMSSPLPEGLELVSKNRRLAVVSELLAKTSRSGAPIPGFSLQQKGVTAYCLANGVPLKPKPEFGESTADVAQLNCGDNVTTTGEIKGDWVHVTCASRKAKGWIHRAALTLDKSLCSGARKIGAIPKTLVYISNVKEPTTFTVAIVSGGVRLGSGRLLADHGMCVVMGDLRLSAAKAGVSMKGFGIRQTLAFLRPWRPYFYSSGKRTFEPLEDLVRAGKQVATGKDLPSEPPAVVVQSKAARRWPALTSTPKGRNPVRVVNPNGFAVKVAIRLGTKGADFDVRANSRNTVHLPNGRWDIYFQYANDPDSLYQGDSFTLADQGVEIQLVKVRNGNYSIRKVK